MPEICVELFEITSANYFIVNDQSRNLLGEQLLLINKLCKALTAFFVILQLDHRILATTTLLSIGGFWWATRKLDMHPGVRSLIGSVMGMAALQVICLWHFKQLLYKYVLRQLFLKTLF